MHSGIIKESQDLSGFSPTLRDGDGDDKTGGTPLVDEKPVSPHRDDGDKPGSALSPGKDDGGLSPGQVEDCPNGSDGPNLETQEQPLEQPELPNPEQNQPDEPETSAVNQPEKATGKAFDLDSDVEVEDADTQVVETPERVPPQPLSKAAANARLRRVFTPRSDGSYQVPPEALEQWKDKDRRCSLERMFERCAYNPATRFFAIICFCSIMIFQPFDVDQRWKTIVVQRHRVLQSMCQTVSDCCLLETNSGTLLFIMYALLHFPL